MNKKKIIGLAYQGVIFAFIAFIYYSLIVNLFFLNRDNMFSGAVLTAFSVAFLVFFHVLLALIIYCYIACVVKNPGQPPKFWVG